MKIIPFVNILDLLDVHRINCIWVSTVLNWIVCVSVFATSHPFVSKSVLSVINDSHV